MGSWNGTCAVSNLHIPCTEEVVGVLLTSSGNVGDCNSGPYGYHRVVPTFIEGVYDDYGRIEDIHGAMAPVLLGTIRSIVVPSQPKQNGITRVAPPENMSWLELQDMMPVELTAAGNPTLRLVMVRKDVMDEIVEQHTFTMYVDGVSEVGYSSLMSDFDDVYTHMQSALRQMNDDSTDVGLRFLLERTIFSIPNNCLARLLDTDHPGENVILNPKEFLLELMVAEQPKDYVYGRVSEMIKMIILSSFMMGANRQWVVPGYAGQEGDTDPHLLLSNIIIEITEKIHAEMEEW